MSHTGEQSATCSPINPGCEVHRVDPAESYFRFTFTRGTRVLKFLSAAANLHFLLAPLARVNISLALQGFKNQQ